MKVQQTQKEFLVISSFLIILLLFNSCKTSKKLKQTYESYNIVKSTLGFVSAKHLYTDAKTDYDTIVLFKNVLKYSKANFEERIVFFRKINKVSKNRFVCADTIYEEFNFKEVTNSTELFDFWDFKKIDIPKVINKKMSQLSIEDTRIELSAPIFNKDYTKALILVDYHNQGKIIFYLKNNGNRWEVNCELYISQY